MHKTGLILAAAGLAGLSMTTQAQQGERFIILASTTSNENSGLFDAILPPFTAATDIEVRVLAVGTGQAFEIARRGGADSLHHLPMRPPEMSADPHLGRIADSSTLFQYVYLLLTM